MISSQLRTLSLLQNCVRYETVRSLRGGVTIPLKVVKSPIPPKKKSEQMEKEFRRLRRSNRGIAHSLHGYMEDNAIASPADVEPEILEDMDVSMEDTQVIFHETRDEAWKTEQLKTYYNAKRKHFKDEKLPNMLTYMEKQTIKRLHRQDKEYWTYERLAESYPATPEIIKKIIKSRFVAYTVHDIREHDRRVQHNWHLFKSGQLNFDDELREKYSNFMNRPKQEMDDKELKKLIPPPPDFASQIPVKEFSSIISSSKAYKLKEKNKLETEDDGRMIYNAPTENPKVIPEYIGSYDFKKQHFTLEEFRKNIISETPDQVSEIDRVIVKEEPPAKLPEPAEMDTSQMDYENDVSYSRDTGVVSRNYNPFMLDETANDNYPLRINIPRKMWRKNKVFKVGDCFYNDRGYFLYRVPGFVN